MARKAQVPASELRSSECRETIPENLAREPAQNLEFEHMLFAFIPMNGLESLANALRNSC
jgi:hypothetical protein